MLGSLCGKLSFPSRLSPYRKRWRAARSACRVGQGIRYSGLIGDIVRVGNSSVTSAGASRLRAPGGPVRSPAIGLGLWRVSEANSSPRHQNFT